MKKLTTEQKSAVVALREQAAKRWNCAVQEIDYISCVWMILRGESLPATKEKIVEKKVEKVVIRKEIGDFLVEERGRNEYFPLIVTLPNGEKTFGKLVEGCRTRRQENLDVISFLGEEKVAGKKVGGISLDKEQLASVKKLVEKTLAKIAADEQADLLDRTEKVNAHKVESLSLRLHSSDGWSASVENLQDYSLHKDVQTAEEILKVVKKDKFFKESMEKYKISSDYGDYSCWDDYKITLAELVEIGAEAKKKIEEKQAEQDKKSSAKREERKKVIEALGLKFAGEKREAGEIRFTVESMPRKEEAAGLLNSPAPTGGAFMTNDRIEKSDWAKIKDHARYYSREDLEDFDMFFHERGWRYTIEALKKLSQLGYNVTVE